MMPSKPAGAKARLNCFCVLMGSRSAPVDVGKTGDVLFCDRRCVSISMHQFGTRTRTGLWSFSDADAYSDESDRSVRGVSYAAVGTAVTSPGDEAQPRPGRTAARSRPARCPGRGPALLKASPAANLGDLVGGQ